MIRSVRVSKDAQKQLKSVPAHIANKLRGWVQAVGEQGLEEVRKLPGYHDEPLRGRRTGQRSIRLNQQWRAIYEVVEDVTLIALVIEVTPHKYGR